MPMGNYGNVSYGVETKFQGTITRVPELGRNKVTFECADPLYLLNMKVPSRLLQSNCPWSFGDDPTGAMGRCHVSNPAANYTVEFTAGLGVTQAALVGSPALTQPDGYFTQGVVTCVTGNNAGLAQTVKSYLGGLITVMNPWLMPVEAGDTFTVIKGCDKTDSTCAATTYTNGTAEPNNWQQRFGGTPYVPPPSNAL